MSDQTSFNAKQTAMQWENKVNLNLTVESREGHYSRPFEAKNLVIAGWTGRNREAMEAHVAELEEIGIARPKRMPEYYRNGLNLLTTDTSIEVVGDHSSGEIEFVLYIDKDEIFVGLGSDHTDREVEKTNVTVSKQVCPKPVSAAVWKYSDICDHWESLALRSHAVIDGQRALYQEGPVTTMKDPMDLLKEFEDRGGERNGLVMYCGTLAVHGGVRPAQSFEMELRDSVLNRSIRHRYDAHSLEMGD